MFLYYLNLAHSGGLEPPTVRLEGGCSIQLSYERVVVKRIAEKRPTSRNFRASHCKNDLES